MAAEGNLFSMVLPGYWMDIGQPKDFLTGMCLHLDYLNNSSGDNTLTTGPKFIGNVMVVRCMFTLLAEVLLQLERAHKPV